MTQERKVGRSVGSTGDVSYGEGRLQPVFSCVFRSAGLDLGEQRRTSACRFQLINDRCGTAELNMNSGTLCAHDTAL